MNKNSKEPRSTNSGGGRMGNRRHRPLFEEELQEEIRSVERAPQSKMPVHSRRGGANKGGFFRTAKIVTKVILEEAVAFLKWTLAKRSARTVAISAAVCVIGLAAIISVAAAASSRKDEDTVADASLVPEVGQVEAAGSTDPAYGEETEESDSKQSDSSDGFRNILAAIGKETEADTSADGKAEKDSGSEDETAFDKTDKETADGESTEDETAKDTSAESDETTGKGTNTVTVTFWGKESAIYESGAATVGEFLTESGIALTDAQRANIDTSIPIGGDITISADVVTYDKETVDEVIKFKTEYRESSQYPAGTTQTTQYGKDGSQTREYTVTYVNGEEVSREQTASWINSSSVTQIIVTGTGNAAPEETPPVSAPSPSGGGTFVGADGIERAYTHYIDVRATCYYVGGTTALGLPADENVIAVDPSVIPLGTSVYVTGNFGDFGVRIAADTGSSITGYKIDICIDPSDPRAGTFGWRDMRVYFLA